jgi:maltokinase
MPSVDEPTAEDITELLDLVRAWMPRQRWFAGKDHTITDLGVAALWPLAAPPSGTVTTPAPTVLHLVLEVELDDGTRQTYQVPLAIRRPYVATDAAGRSDAPAPARAADEDGPVRVGQLRDGSEVVDALTDPETMAAFLVDPADPAVLDPDLTHAESGGGPRAPQLQVNEPTQAWGNASARRMAIEQSNTSYVLDDTLLVKAFRRLAPGINPDIEVHEALGRAGSTHIGRCRGWVNGSWYETAADPASGVSVLRTGHLAMVQDLLRPAVDGWELACQRAADGSPFVAEARALGVATAEVHRDLRQVLPTKRLDPAELSGLVDRLRTRLEDALVVVPELASLAERLRQRIDDLGRVSGGLVVQRVHGDYHLGQVLLVGESWKMLDFEGEPGAPISARVAPDHALRDVAGMLRSFGYAAAQGGAQRSAEQRRQWQAECESAFLDGYGPGSSGSASHRDLGTGDADTILTAYLVDKAAYEAVYEKRNRPDWLPIPLAALARLAD